MFSDKKIFFKIKENSLKYKFDVFDVLKKQLKLSGQGTSRHDILTKGKNIKMPYGILGRILKKQVREGKNKYAFELPAILFKQNGNKTFISGFEQEINFAVFDKSMFIKSVEWGRNYFCFRLGKKSSNKVYSKSEMVNYKTN